MQIRLTLSIVALAATSAASARITPSFEVGPEVYQETYTETVNGQRFMQEKATMTGITGAATLHFDPVNALKFSGRYAVGKSDYTGAYQGGSYGSLTSSGQDRSTYELRGVYQATLPFFGHALMPSAGLGYRNLTDRLDQAGSGGYKRESEYLYSTFGLASHVNVGLSHWEATPTFSVNELLQGTQHSYIGGVDVQNTQHNGYGLEVSVAFVRALDRRSSLHITPFFRYWHIQQSDYGYYWSNGQYKQEDEPDNTTKEFGLNLSLQF